MKNSLDKKLDDYISVYNMLEDEESKDIYLKRLNYLISGKSKYIDDIVTAYLPNVPLFKETALDDIKNALPEDRKIILYGAGSKGRDVLNWFSDDKRFAGFCSQTKEKQENGYCGWPVISPEELLARKDMSVIISTTRSYGEIKQILEAGNYPRDQIYNLQEIVYEDPGQYFAPDFMIYEDEEILIDAGCYDLNSILQMRKYCKHLKKAYGFEPDMESYKVCLKKISRFHLEDKVELLPFGVWSREAELPFIATHDGASSIHTGGVGKRGLISCTTIDALAAKNPEERITLIKMDIEGSELEALKGAKRTILKDKPKLAVCIYHKPEDLTKIPLYIKRLVPEYRLFVRHHSNKTTETVLYAVLPE